VIRFGAGSLADLGDVAAELGRRRLLLVTTKRGAASVSDLPVVGVYDGVRSHVPAETVREAAALAAELEADGLVGIGGGSAIDTCKAVAAAQARDLATDCCKVIAVPTTYAGAEWTSFFGVLEGRGRKGGGSDERARPVAAVYDPLLTLELPIADSVGTAMNALAHCVEALYVPQRSERGDRHAYCGATTIGYALPLVAADPGSVYARSRLLEGAMRAALALGETSLAFGHALAQALGGRYDLPQGHMNAVSLPAALRFNAPAAPDAVETLTRAFGTTDVPKRFEELAALGGFPLRLRDHGVPEEDLPAVAAAVVARPGTRNNPRPVSEAGALAVLRRVW
jgi:maleylacetate reductase